jgi:hypothetical protein
MFPYKPLQSKVIGGMLRALYGRGQEAVARQVA